MHKNVNNYIPKPGGQTQLQTLICWYKIVQQQNSLIYKEYMLGAKRWIHTLQNVNGLCNYVGQGETTIIINNERFLVHFFLEGNSTNMRKTLQRICLKDCTMSLFSTCPQINTCTTKKKFTFFENIWYVESLQTWHQWAIVFITKVPAKDQHLHDLQPGWPFEGFKYLVSLG